MFLSLLLTAFLLDASLPQVLGRVEGETVTTIDVQAVLNRWTSQAPSLFQDMKADEKRELLTELTDYLITRRLLLQEAGPLPQPSKSEVLEEYRRSQENFLQSGSTRRALSEGYARVELSEADARDSLLIKKLEERMMKGIIILPTEVEEYWKKNREIYLEIEKKKQAPLEEYRERIVTALQEARWRELKASWVSTLKAKARIWNYFDGPLPESLSPDLLRKIEHQEGVVAAVNGEPVTLSELEERVRSLTEAGRERKALLNRLLDRLIEERLIFMDAKQMGIGVSREDFDERLRKFQAKLPSPEAFAEMLKKSGVDMERWKKAKAYDLLIEEVESKRREEIIIKTRQEDPILFQKWWRLFGRGDWLGSLRRKARIWYNFPSLIAVGMKAPLNIQGPAVVYFGRTGLPQPIKDATSKGHLSFIHMNTEKDPGMVDRWGLEREPWIFLVDDQNSVRASLPGDRSLGSLEEEIQRLSNNPLRPER